MTTARERAAQLYPSAEDAQAFTHDEEGAMRYNNLVRLQRYAFMNGAEWQAAQPVKITDEMIEIA